MKKILLIFVVTAGVFAWVFWGVSKSFNDTNVTIRSTFSSDVYTSASTMQQFMFGFMNAVGTVKYPADWENKIKSKDDYIILPMHNANTNITNPCLVKGPMHGTMLVESCL